MSERPAIVLTREEQEKVDKKLFDAVDYIYTESTIDERLRQIEEALAAGAKVDAREDLTLRTPLYHAAREGNIDIVNALLSAGAKVNARDNEDDTPLHYAASAGHVDVVNALYSAGADINATQASTLRTPLYYAAFSGNVGTVNALLKAGADITARDSNKTTPLHRAARSGKVDIVNALLSAGADINATDLFGTPLHFAALDGDREIANALLRAGADITARDSDGNTPLHWAASSGEVGIVNALLDAGADITARNSNDDTPLHSAASSGKVDVVNTLHNAGADINTRNRAGLTPLDEAIKRNNPELVNTLLAANIIEWSKDPSTEVYAKEASKLKKTVQNNAQENLENILATCLPSLILKGQASSMPVGLYKDREGKSPQEYLAEHAKEIAKLKKDDPESKEEIAWRQADALMLLHASGEWSNIKEQQEAYQQFTGASPAETKSHNLTIEGLFNSVVTGKDLPNIPFEEDSPFKKPSSLISLTEGMSSFSDETIRELGATIASATKNRKSISEIANILVQTKEAMRPKESPSESPSKPLAKETGIVKASKPKLSEDEVYSALGAAEEALRKKATVEKEAHLSYRKAIADEMRRITCYDPNTFKNLDVLAEIINPQAKVKEAEVEPEHQALKAEREARIAKAELEEARIKATAEAVGLTGTRRTGPLKKTRVSSPAAPSASAIQGSLTRHNASAVDTGIHGSVPTPRDKTSGRG